MEKVKGSCRCGNVVIRASGDPYRVGICHCMDCRKYHGALFHASAIFPKEAVVILGETKEYDGRSFCPRCGSPLFSRSDDEIEVSLGCLDETDQFTPTYESWTIRREIWLKQLPSTNQYIRDRDNNKRVELFKI